MSISRFTPYIKKAAFAVLIIILVLVLRSRVISLTSTFNRTDMLSSLQEELSAKKQGNAYLKEKLFIAKTDEFVEEEARTKLGMVREGEKIVGDRKIEAKKVEIEKPELQNWQKWQNLFF